MKRILSKLKSLLVNSNRKSNVITLPESPLNPHYFVQRELMQKRNVEKWTINMLSHYYGCTEQELRSYLDYYNIK